MNSISDYYADGAAEEENDVTREEAAEQDDFAARVIAGAHEDEDVLPAPGWPDTPPQPTFSFICPCYNEQDGLELFHQRLSAIAEKLEQPYEIIFVNDGSSDQTMPLLQKLLATDPHVRVVDFSRNFGHQVAVTAGYDYATGRAVISLDSDCQHPPELIPELVAKWREGYEIVYTVRKDTKGISVLRRSVGRLVYWVIRKVSGVELTDQADFRLMDAKAVDALRKTREHARFVRGLVKWIGFRQTAVPFVADKRAAGRSNYSIKQLSGMATAGMFNFSVRPLRLANVLGAMFVTAAVVYLAAALALWPFGYSPSPLLSVVMAVVGMFGVQFFVLGVLGEYLGRIFEEARARPLYVVRETLGFPVPTKQALPRPQNDAKKNGISVFT